MESWVLAELGLFISAFISSTIAPGGSEAWLSWLVAQGRHDPVRLLLIASVGNTLGALTTWGLGFWISHVRGPEAVFSHLSPATLHRVQRWGVPVLLLSWLPVIGDGFCLAAGWLRFPFIASILAIFIGKLARYWVIIQVVGRVAAG